MSKALLSILRRDALRVELPRVADLLHRRRAGEIDDAVIDDLVALSWLEWLGGTLQLTATGSNICRQQIPK
ncbi:hypothetical protein QTH91_02755 [Variovorax dokdonensis]|uniref:Uncharacterized protein n=1 Tax=Variovorax dokdonensis TaxID=344883 RepID=A0ABT7N614_9BURK|nr:hypothetical protein [Variovorax dokdonensis]MDM0043391.1 hypothetical protein [Variovorax dokdonensis]